jgi:perosamine synthetase
MKIPMSSPDITQTDVDAVKSVLQTPIHALGPQALEQAIATYTGSTYAVAVNSGTSGLHLAVIAAGIQADDEVISPSFSFIASVTVCCTHRANWYLLTLTDHLDPN